MENVRLGIIGLGGRGMGILKLVLSMPNVTVTALSDKRIERAQEGAGYVTEKNQPMPFITSDYNEVLDKNKIDAVIIITSWEYHTEISIAALKAKIPCGSEVNGEFSLQNCWDLVNAQAETKTPYMFLENCCYGQTELFATKMARDGMFGEIVHCDGAYSHDLRDEVTFGGLNKHHYRLDNYKFRNSENYPTHELGPISKLLNINRSNRILNISSIASKARGLEQYVADHADELSALKGVRFAQGDIIDTILTCANGETISLRLDTTLPHFYSRNFRVLGTKGRYEQDANMVFLDGVHKDRWDTVGAYKEMIDNAKDYYDKYMPAIWANDGEIAKKYGHGGMDYYVYNAFLDMVRNGTESPIDVYDAATWMAVTVLSEESISKGGMPISVPDFTNGKWMIREPKDVCEL